MKKIQISKGIFATVDDADYETVSQYKWFTIKRGYGYARAIVDGKLVNMQNIIFGKPIRGMVTDHINGNRYDNRKENLRFCTFSQNRQNAKVCRDSQSGLRGVFKRTGIERYKVEIKVGKNHLYIGDFKDKFEAAKAYDQAAIKHFGEFARLNQVFFVYSLLRE